MVWPARSPGRSLEAEGDLRSREMTVLDRIRLTGLFGLSAPPRRPAPVRLLARPLGAGALSGETPCWPRAIPNTGRKSRPGWQPSDRWPVGSWGPDAKPVANGLAAESPTVENGGVAKDFTSVTWKLRKDAKWSDGSAFTADDVVFTWQYLSNKETASPSQSITDDVSNVEAVDPNTVKVTYKQANANYYIFGVGQNSGILQKKQFGDFIGAKAKDAPGNLKPIGTGPYTITDFKSGDVVQYAMNPNFRDANKPFFKTVTFKGGGDAVSSARAVFQTGDVDYAWNLQVEPAVLRQLSTGSQTGELFTA